MSRTVKVTYTDGLVKLFVVASFDVERFIAQMTARPEVESAQ
jgi:hypothetical protein